VLVGLDSQRLAGKLTHLKLEINPLYLEAPIPWHPKLVSSFKELVENSLCVSQQDIYRKAKGNNGVVPKTNSICPMP